MAANEIEEFPAEDIQEFDLSDEFSRPRNEIIDVGPEVKARKKKFLADEMARARQEGQTIEQVRNAADWANYLGESYKDLPSNLLNVPSRGISALTGSQPILTKPGESFIPEVLPSADTLAQLEVPNVYPSQGVKLGPYVGGGIKAVEDLVRGVATPEVALTAGAGAVPGMLSRAPAGAFAAQMTQHLPETAAEAGRLSVEGTPAEAVRAGVGAVGTVAMLGHMAHGGSAGKSESKPIMGEHGIEEFSLEPKGGKNALESQTTPTVRPVREEPIQSQGEVPVTSPSRAPDVRGSEEGSLSVSAPQEVNKFAEDIFSGTPSVVTDQGKIFTGQDHGDAKNRAEEAGYTVSGNLGEKSGWIKNGKNYSIKEVDDLIANEKAKSSLKEVSPEVSRFIDEYNKPGSKVNNIGEIGTVKTGLAVKNVSDLDALLELNNQVRGELARIRAKREAKEPLTPEETAFYFGNAGRAQFPREVVETATNYGGWSEENQAKGPVPRPLGERPLDHQKNPEVASWLKAHGKELGLDTTDIPAGALKAGEGFTYEMPEPPSMKDVQAELSKIQEEFPGGLKVNVVENHHDLPDRAHITAYRQKVNPVGIKGYVDGKTVWINRQMLDNAADIRKLFLHEQAGHFATDRILGPKLKSFMDSVHDSFTDDPLMGETRILYKGADKTTLGREFVARLSENPKLAPTVWNKVVAQFRSWLRDIGWVKEVSENDIRVLLNRAMESLRERESGNPPQEGSLSVGTPKEGDGGLEFTPLDPQSGTPISESMGLGGNRPEPSREPFTTSNKNRIVDAERKTLGLKPAMEPERQGNPAAWDEAMAKIDRRPQAVDDLILELKGAESMVPGRAKPSNPRALTPVENAMLLHRRVELRTDLEKSLRSWQEAFQSGDSVKAAEQSQIAGGIKAQLQDLSDITKATGTESGRSLQARKMEANEDFSLAKMTLEAMEAKGRDLTPQEHIELIKLHDKIKELQDHLNLLEGAKESIDLENKAEAQLKETAETAKKEAKSKDLDPDREEKLLGSIGAKVEKGQLSEITGDVQKLARVLWLRGFQTRDALINELHNTLSTIIPGLTKEDTQRAFSGYGKFKPLSKEEVDVGLRDLRGQTQQVLKMEAIENRRPLEKTGQERREPSDEERRLIKQVNELKRKFGVVVTDPATQLKSALQSRKTYYEHRISDLKHEIATRERIVKTKSPSPTDPQLEAMKAEYDRLKTEHEAIFVKPGLTDAQRLKIATAAANRSLANWELRLENAEKGIFNKNQPSQKVTSPELDAIRAEAVALREQVKELEILANPRKTRQEIALQSLKTRMKNREAELREKLAKGDFSKKAKTEVPPDPEAKSLKAQLDLAKQDYEHALEADRWKKSSIWEKTRTQAGKFWDASRAIMTTGELSFILRQGKFQALSHPLRTARALPDTFKALLGNDQKVREIENQILDHPDLEQARRDKLFIDEHQSSRLSRQEEIMMGRWVGQIPVVKNFNNAARVFLNKIRFDTWQAMRKSLGRAGEVTPEEGRQIAMFVNEATGRGGLGKMEAAAVPLARVMFSPRYFASRLQMAAGHSMWGGTPRTRKLIAAEYGKALIGLSLYYTMLSAYFHDDKDKKKGSIEFDPRSSDFGKVRLGNTRIDPLAGIAQVASFGAKTGTTAMNALAGTNIPEVKRLNGQMGHLRGPQRQYGQDKWTDVAARFAQSKAHPIIGVGANLLNGKDLGGKEATPANQALGLVEPITYVDIYQALKEQGLEDGAAVALLGFLGEGVQTYQKKK